MQLVLKQLPGLLVAASPRRRPATHRDVTGMRTAHASHNIHRGLSSAVGELAHLSEWLAFDNAEQAAIQRMPGPRWQGDRGIASAVLRG
ncbi:hypothetical protein GCM10009534_48160 [Kribbella sandramycini]